MKNALLSFYHKDCSVKTHLRIAFFQNIQTIKQLERNGKL